MTLQGRFEAGIDRDERSRRLYEEREWLASFGKDDETIARELGIDPRSLARQTYRKAAHDNDRRTNQGPSGRGLTKTVEAH